MPAHISFYTSMKALGYSVGFKASGVKGMLRWKLAKLTGKTSSVQFTNLEKIALKNKDRGGGGFSTSDIRSRLLKIEQQARQVEVTSYVDYRTQIDRYDPQISVGNHRSSPSSRATSVSREEWDTYFAIGTAFDATINSIFAENDGRVLSSSDLSITMQGEEHHTKKHNMAKIARVLFIASAKGVNDLKRIEVSVEPDKYIIAWTCSK